MRLSTFTRRALTAAVGTAVALSVTAVPAQAADHRMPMTRGGEVIAVATWDDSIDTLCIKVTSARADDYAFVGIRAVDGHTEPPRDPREVSAQKRDGRLCTPNLRIREDVKYEMYMQWRGTRDGQLMLQNSRRTTFFS